MKCSWVKFQNGKEIMKHGFTSETFIDKNLRNNAFKLLTEPKLKKHGIKHIVVDI